MAGHCNMPLARSVNDGGQDGNGDGDTTDVATRDEEGVKDCTSEGDGDSEGDSEGDGDSDGEHAVIIGTLMTDTDNQPQCVAWNSSLKVNTAPYDDLTWWME